MSLRKRMVELRIFIFSMKSHLLAVVFIACSMVAFAGAPKYSNDFLSIGVGGRALGMAGAQVASVQDATSGFWNPAGLTLIRGDLEIAAMHTEYFAGIGKYDYGCLAAKIDATRTVAFSVIRFGVDDIPDTSELLDASGNINYDRLKSFSVGDYAFIFSYAMKAKKEGLRFGGSAKLIHRKAGDFAKAWGFGLDAGAQYAHGKWMFGLMAKDITSTFNGWSFNTEKLESVFAQTGNEIPQNSMEVTLPRLILGAAYKQAISTKFSVMAELNTDFTFDGKRNVLFGADPVSVDPHIGLEFGYADFVFLRGGVNNIQEVKDFDGTTSTILQPAMGIGVRIQNFSIEYAMTNIGSQETPYSNVFSLKLDINKRKE